MSRPFRSNGAGFNAGMGFAAGANDMVQNFTGIMDLGNRTKYADVAQRRQAMDEGDLLARRNPGVQPTSVTGGAGGAAGAQAVATGGPTPMDGEEGAVGAQALAGTPPVQGPPNPYDPENLSVDDLRTLAFDRAQEAKGAALGNQNDIESLQKAYHYNSLMKAHRPEMDRWAKALMEVKKNPQDMKAYRTLQVLTGQDDPTAALSMATNEYAKLREKYEGYSKQYGPLNDYLTKRGITGDMYDDEAKFIQFMNQKQFMPHTPGAAKIPRPKTSGQRQGR